MAPVAMIGAGSLVFCKTLLNFKQEQRNSVSGMLPRRSAQFKRQGQPGMAVPL